MKEFAARAILETGVDTSGVSKGMQEVDREARKAGTAAEKALGDQVAKGARKGGDAIERDLGRKGRKAVDELDRSTKGLVGRFNQLAQSKGIIGGIFTGVGMGAGISAFDMVSKGVRSVIDLVGSATAAASDLAESQGKVGVVFAESAGSVLSWSSASAKAMGISQQAALEAAGTYGNLLTAMGLAEGRAADMSTSLVQLAADLGSFNNTDTQSAIEALRSGIVGEAEPLKRYGIALRAADVDARAMAMGLAKTTKELTEQDRIQARYAIILEQTAKAQGDFARTAQGQANKTKIQAAEQENLNAKIGALLSGPADLWLDFLSGSVDFAEQAVEQLKDLAGMLHDIQRIIDPTGAKIEDWMKQFRMDPQFERLADETLERYIKRAIEGGATLQEALTAAPNALWTSTADAAERSEKLVEGTLRNWQRLFSSQGGGVGPDGPIVTDEMTRWIDQFIDDDLRRLLLAAEDLPADFRAALMNGAPKVAEGADALTTTIAERFAALNRDVGSSIPATKAELAKLPELFTTSWETIRKKVKEGGKTRVVVRQRIKVESRLEGLEDEAKRNRAAIREALEQPGLRKKIGKKLADEIEWAKRQERKAAKSGNLLAMQQAREYREDMEAELKAYNAMLEREARRAAFLRAQMLAKGTFGPSGVVPGYAGDPGFGRRAEGGPVTRGRPYIVGEKRPEIFIPDVNGRIEPRVDYSAIAALSHGGGSSGSSAPQVIRHEHQHTITREGAANLRAAGYDERRVAGFLVAYPGEADRRYEDIG